MRTKMRESSRGRTWMDEAAKCDNILTHIHNVVNDVGWEGVYFQEF